MRLHIGGPGMSLAIAAGIAAEVVALRMVSSDPAVLLSMIGGVLGAGVILLGIGRWAFKAAAREMIADAKAEALRQRDQDQATPVDPVRDAKAEPAALVAEAARREEVERARMHGENQRLLTKAIDVGERTSDNVQEIALVLYGPKGRGGVLGDLAYTSAMRHAAIDHIQAIEAYLHLLSTLPGHPQFHQPPAIDRGRRRDDRE
jgi:hypothetical protein